MNFIHKRLLGVLAMSSLIGWLVLLVVYALLVAIHPRVELSESMVRGYTVFYPSVISLGMLFHHLRTTSGIAHRQSALDQFSPLALTGRQTLAVLFTLIVGLVLAKDILISRAFLLTFAPIAFVALFLANEFVFRFAGKVFFGGRHEMSTLLVANVTAHDPLMNWLQTHNLFGLRPALIFADNLPEEYRHLDGSEIGSSPEEVIRLTHPQIVICCDGAVPPKRITSIRQCCEQTGSRFAVHFSQFAGHGSRMSIYKESEHSLAMFRPEPLQSPFNRLMKRILDVAVAVPIIVFVLPPLCLLVMVLQAIQSPGPLFFRQMREGAGGYRFSVYKFRTMRCDNGDEGLQATSEDSRIFRAGKWLRKFSIDEFPQFLNVLRGEMSVVGPRPHYVEHDVEFTNTDPLYRLRKNLKPGVTGLSQVAGYRGETRTRADIRKRSYTDLAYLERWSLKMDLFIIFRTVLQVIRPPKGAM